MSTAKSSLEQFKNHPLACTLNDRKSRLKPDQVLSLA